MAEKDNQFHLLFGDTVVSYENMVELEMVGFLTAKLLLIDLIRVQCSVSFALVVVFPDVVATQQADINSSRIYGMIHPFLKDAPFHSPLLLLAGVDYRMRCTIYHYKVFKEISICSFTCFYQD